MRQPSRIFRGKVGNGKLWIEGGRGELDAHIARLDGFDVEVIVRKLRRKRSLPQNAYFHGVVCPLISEHTGYEPEEVKEILKHMFLLVDDGKYKRVRHTSSLDTVEMIDFVDRCIRWAATELHVVIPDPGAAA